MTIHLLTRSESIALGHSYYEGSPCPRGHTTRYTKSTKCVKCRRLLSSNWKKSNNHRRSHTYTESQLNNVLQEERRLASELEAKLQLIKLSADNTKQSLSLLIESLSLQGVNIQIYWDSELGTFDLFTINPLLPHSIAEV